MRILLGVLVLAACGGGSGAPDATSTDAEALTCQDLQRQYDEALAALDDACVDVGDCMLIGEVTTCNGESHLQTACGGVAVGRAAYEAAAAADAFDEIFAADAALGCTSGGLADCGELGCTADCSPSYLRCSDQGRCVAETNDDCWDGFADAGVADAI